MKFSTLYKKTSTGAIQFWEISTEMGCAPPGNDMRGVILTVYGQIGTDSPQKTSETIEIGKNIGKKNETTAVQQAESEAKSRWEKKKKSGYVENITSAENEELDSLVEGGIVPMLAHKFSDHGHKIKYPAYVQPKLDGIRCIAILKNGKCTLWSRTRKPITSMPHIVEQIEKLKVDIILDGELYNSKFKDNFEYIVHLVRQEDPDINHKDVQYHVYDIAMDGPFSSRATKLRYMKESWFDGHIMKVQTLIAQDEYEAAEAFEAFMSEGYEGAMMRNADGLYVNKRSYDLQKMKEMLDDEFKIVGIEEGRGKLSGHVGAFICITENGHQFKAKMSGDTEKLREYFENHNLWENKQITVQYQGLTSYNVPRFPVGKIIRDYE